MPIPLVIIGAAAGAVSLGMTAHSALKQRKWKKIHDERFAELQSVQKEAEGVYDRLVKAGKSLGKRRVHASNTLKEAAEYLRAIAKEYELESLPQIPSEALKEWINLPSEIAKSLGIGSAGSAASGVAAAAPGAIYTAAGLFGVASTGTRIAGLSGAAAQSARLAWIGGGALSAGGGGVALGSTVLNVLTKANVVMAPIGLAAGIWSEKKAHDFEKKVTSKVREFATAESRLRQKITAMQVSIDRVNELERGIRETETALRGLLSKATTLPPLALPSSQDTEDNQDDPDFHAAHQIYLTAKALRELIEQPAISDASRRIIEG